MSRNLWWRKQLTINKIKRNPKEVLVPSFKDLEEKNESVAISHRNLQISTTKLRKIRINTSSDNFLFVLHLKK